jgi:hypothetical protein
MKEMHRASLARKFFAVFCASLALASGGYAQTGTSVSVVTVQATQPIATGTNSGVFTVFRAGDTNAALNVWYELGGTASNGVDYAAVSPHLVAIPAGATSNTIVIKPLANPSPASVVRTVVLTLTNSPLMTPINYEIGSPSRAVVFLESTNFPPLFPPLLIATPKDGTVFYTPTNILIVAEAIDFFVWPTLTNVEFFAGTNDLGKGILYWLLIPEIQGFSLTWTNPPPGDYALTAIGTYTNGASATSAPVNITVQLPPTNLPPVAKIFSPTNGQIFVLPPTNSASPIAPGIPLFAAASDADGYVTNVEFFADGHDLGPGAMLVLDPPGVNGVTGPVWYLIWFNPPAGHHVLTAVATDDDGASRNSNPVGISVQQSPPTNLPPVARIISPPNGAVFRAPMRIPIFAFAADIEDAVTSVQFFASGASIGFGHPVTSVPLPWLTPIIQPTNFWGLTWTNPALGINIPLTAIATDGGGLSTTSKPVLVSILPSLPPPTNRPAIVRIVATDPVAIEGTNCWTWPGLAGPTATWSNWLAPNATFRLFTNCGPKNATFSVFRFGDTNSDLEIAYAIGGTATNGVDYVTLPGAVTIPAGARRADITIVPLDDGPPDITSTVVLKLIPDATGTNHLLGYPRAAAAIILDSQSPRVATGIVPGSAFNLTAAGPDGAWFHVEYSTDLLHWTSICTNQVVNGSIDFVDPDADANPVRYYRTVPEAGPPQ